MEVAVAGVASMTLPLPFLLLASVCFLRIYQSYNLSLSSSFIGTVTVPAYCVWGCNVGTSMIYVFVCSLSVLVDASHATSLQNTVCMQLYT